MTVELKELRNVLLGRTTLTEDGRITPVQKGEFRVSAGVGDGAVAVRFWGIAKHSCCFETKLEPDAVNEAARKSMQEIGRGVSLRWQPDTVACLIRYVLTRPTVLTFRYIDNIPTLTAWSGRGIPGWLSLRRAVKAFDKGLPEEIVRSDRETPKLPECVRGGKTPRKRKNRKAKNAEPERPEEQPPVES